MNIRSENHVRFTQKQKKNLQFPFRRAVKYYTNTIFLLTMNRKYQFIIKERNVKNKTTKKQLV